MVSLEANSPERKKRTHRELLAMVLADGMTIATIPPQQRTLKIMLSAVETHGMAVQFLDKEERTHQILVAAVRNNPWALGKLYFSECTLQIYEEAVKQDGNVIQLFIVRFDGSDFERENIILLALKTTPLAIQFIPSFFRTAKICFIAIKLDSKCIDFLTAEELIRASKYRG